MQNITLMQTGKKVRDERKNDLIAECSLVHVNKWKLVRVRMLMREFMD